MKYLDPDGRSISDDGPKGLVVNDSTGKNIIVSPGDKYNYVEAAIINYINTGDIRWLNKIPDSSDPLTVEGIKAFVCDYLGIAQESIVAGVSSYEMLGIITAGSMELAATAQKTSNAVVGKIKNVYKSIKDAPKYPKEFKPAKNGLRKVKINNMNAYSELKDVESGTWYKCYKDGYDADGNKISIHYFQSESGQVFDVKVKSEWSNPSSY